MLNWKLKQARKRLIGPILLETVPRPSSTKHLPHVKTTSQETAALCRMKLIVRTVVTEKLDKLGLLSNNTGTIEINHIKSPELFTQFAWVTGMLVT